MLQLPDLIGYLLDHRINLLANRHNLQDVFNQRSGVQDDVEQESVCPARWHEHQRRTNGKE
jgi:hypothetical protein